MRIVLAHGDPMFVNTLQAELRVQGHTVDTAAAGPEALSVLEQAVPDVVLMDGDLPPEGCDSVLAAMLANPALSHLPVIVIMEEANNQFAGVRNHNVVAWIRCPVEFAELEEKLISATQAQPATLPPEGAENI